jgi:beta-lactamase regulating signal transducer with metallopeptidase domain
MWFDSPLAGLSIWITYCVQVVLSYLTTLCICAFIQNPRARVRMWGYFLFLTIATWLLLWVPAKVAGPVHFAFSSASLPAAANLHLALPVKNASASSFAKLVPAALRVYLFLLLVSLLHLFLRSIQLRFVLRRTRQPAPQLQLLFRELCVELGIRRSELGLVPELRSPATCYWLRSHVLLPADLITQLDSQQLADVLRHELSHVRQHDYLWDRLAALGCRLVFFHPMVWLAYRRLRWERELACDRAVVEKRAEARLPYAECLTRLARWFVEKDSVSEGIGFSSSESLLAARVRTLLSEPSSFSNFQKVARVALVGIMATAALFLVPSLGLSLYSPVSLSALIRSREIPINSGSKRLPKSRTQHSSLDRVVAAGSLWKLARPQPLRPVDLFLDSRSTSLPVLQNSPAIAQSPTDTGPMSSDKTNHGFRPHTSGPAWDEAPVPLASPPKWRRLVLGAITSGVAAATGRIDVDDIDSPRKRGR